MGENNMIATHKFSKARSNLTSLIDSVQSNHFQFIAHRKESEDDTLLISRKQFCNAFKKIGYETSVETYKDSDGSITTIFDPFGIIVNSEDRNSIFDDLLDELIIYANEYMDDFELYSRAPNRKDHLPLVILILSCRNKNELKGLFDLAKVERVIKVL